MKTIRQWFEELPPGYRERALKNAWPPAMDTEEASLWEALRAGFDWRRSHEGLVFWNAVDSALMWTGSEFPPLPEDPVKLRAALDAVRAALTECDYGSDFSQGDFDRIVGEVLK